METKYERNRISLDEDSEAEKNEVHVRYITRSGYR